MVQLSFSRDNQPTLSADRHSILLSFSVETTLPAGLRSITTGSGSRKSSRKRRSSVSQKMLHRKIPLYPFKKTKSHRVSMQAVRRASCVFPHFLGEYVS